MSSGNGIITLGEALILGDAIIYLRMSDFRNEDVRTFGERERLLRDFAAGLGVPADRVRVAIENDAGNGGYRPASAYKRPVRVTTATGLVRPRNTCPSPLTLPAVPPDWTSATCRTARSSPMTTLPPECIASLRQLSHHQACEQVTDRDHKGQNG